MRFRDKVALVTGSTQGVGREIAVRLASEECAVVLTGRNSEAGWQAVQQIRASSGQAAFIEADLMANGGPAELLGAAVDIFGRLDVLVNNAAATDIITAHDKAVADTDPDVWDRILHGAATVTLAACQAAIPHLRAAGGGAIVNVSSLAGQLGVAKMAAHCASKAAVGAITRSVAVEHGCDNIRANALVLGFVVSGPRQEAAMADPVRGPMLRSRQLLRMVMPVDVAGAAAFLASDDAACITGVSLTLDGGMSCKLLGL